MRADVVSRLAPCCRGAVLAPLVLVTAAALPVRAAEGDTATATATATVAAAAGAALPATTATAASSAPAPGAVLRGAALPPALEARILAIDPDHVSDDDVRHTLAQGPAPHIMAIHGGIWPVYRVMESFTHFLVAMGYPEHAIRDVGTHRLTYSCYQDGAELAGLAAWYYEHDGVRPMLVGHSQGGMQVVKVLYDLAGLLDKPPQVFNPHSRAFEPRGYIVDPVGGERLPLPGIRVSYATAVGAGGLADVLPNQWSMAERTFVIPDTALEFTGFTLGVDLIAMNFRRDDKRYRPMGNAAVQNVVLPSNYSHYNAVLVGPLADEASMRDWLNAWTPAQRGQDPPNSTTVLSVQWAADVWYSIKQHWALEAQRFVRARQRAAH